MNRISPAFIAALSAPLLAFTGCGKSEKTTPPETVEKAEKAPPAAEVKKAVPVIPPGTWVGTLDDGSLAATLTVIDGTRLAIVQQDVSTPGAYTLTGTDAAATLNFIPDTSPSKTYTSQVRWIDPATIAMTSLAEVVPALSSSAPAPVPTAPPAQPESAPFTGSVPPPPSYTPPVSAPANDPAPPSEIVNITFRLQPATPTP